MLIGIFSFFSFFSLTNVAETPVTEIPNSTVFCGVEITITEKGKEKIREYKKKLYENPTYFNAAVDRGDTYLPFVEEALADIGAPDDLKYVAMQESNLKADAVSSSNAVGFWQFKEEVAKEVGLQVNESIDERKHIYRSSVAAASYISKVNRNYDNWLYAIIAYYEGTTGSVAYTSTDNYGKKSMIIDEKTHWYLLKSIAYKLTYEDALKITFQPNTWLEPLSVTGPITTKALATKHYITEEKLLEFNKWVIKKEIPEGEVFTYYIPHTNEVYRTHTNDPNKGFAGKEIVRTKTIPKTKQEIVTPPVKTEPKPTTVVVPPVVVEPPIVLGKDAVSPLALDKNQYVEIELKDDLYYGEEAVLSEIGAEYILFDGVQSLQDISLNLGIAYSNILSWNNLSINKPPKAGGLIYLKNPKKSRYHVVEEGQSLEKIAKLHHLSVKKIQKKNGMKKTDYTIYKGQRLNLKDTRSKNDKIIILTHNLWKQASVVKPTAVEIESPKAVASIPDRAEETPKPVVTQTVTVMETITVKDTIYFEPSPLTPRWMEHTVAASETLWGISQKYKTTVDIIKKANELKSDALSPGQVLKVFTTFPDIAANQYTSGYYHKVLAGETLDKIASRYGVPAFLIAKKNDIATPNIKPGQVLVIGRE